ncbi:MAG: hypothetical protein F4Y82_06310 [Cenarchaeum sp. SB0665_bin_23]|nr:hypothetical protein [Cenarchaeum sp. SB0667_bin_13]MXY61704.1 hypothetical protein [Cenarchaeum sp. SB0665_bin_23]MYC79639.1 hypothetical protein [Cenarchaeum sp. SB0661_bin_35]MYG33070.1 hypothetical protein [Cenarchaeum sp. SB0677_bin_16]MYI51936.1 hypothetical protein [Cenarchaeum sp. SB0673_bin_9]
MSDNPIKDMLFERLNTATAQHLVSTHDYAGLVRYVVPHCISKSQGMVTYEEAAVIISTGILHYMLTVSATPSQRKITYDGMDVDIVLPNVRQLEREPSLAIIIQISHNCDTAERRLNEMAKIQPVRQNIWSLTPYDCYYSILDGSPSLSDLLQRMIEFSRAHNQSKLGLLG